MFAGKKSTDKRLSLPLFLSVLFCHTDVGTTGIYSILIYINEVYPVQCLASVLHYTWHLNECKIYVYIYIYTYCIYLQFLWCFEWKYLRHTINCKKCKTNKWSTNHSKDELTSYLARNHIQAPKHVWQLHTHTHTHRHTLLTHKINSMKGKTNCMMSQMSL